MIWNPADEERLVGILRASPRVMTVLETVHDLNPPDWRLFSGGVYQTVWNALVGRDPDYGIKDYDIGCFDPDTGWDAEDRVIKTAAAALAPPLDTLVEVRNQARVHLWFADHFGGEAYGPLADTDDALTRFLCPAFCVGVRLETDGRISLAAPFGLDDVFALRLRPNPQRPFRQAAFDRVVDGARARWPELTVEAP